MIVYLHGFNSAYNPSSDKIQALSKIDEIFPLSYNSCDTYKNILQDILQKTQHCADTVFVGTSLGGFYAAACASVRGVPSVLINPVVQGSLIQKIGALYKGSEVVNYVTHEKHMITDEMIDSYDNLDLKDLCYEYKPLLLLDGEDELLDSQHTYDILKDVVSKSSVFYPGGSHRFDHIEHALPSIENYLHNCSCVSHFD